MISFNKIIENFNRVYEDRNSSEKNVFLNSCLELIEDSSQKASFFDIVDALQFRKWEPTSETDTSQFSKKIKRLWLQTKFIYDNEPFSIHSKSRLINLFDKSITEETFSNPTKLEEYGQQIQSYCEILYFCKSIVHAEEKLAHLSEKIGWPTNVKTYYEYLELKYKKVLAFQKSPEFYFLKNIKYTNPLLYLSVFIEGDQGQINKTHLDLLEFFELAERAPTYSKKKTSVKKKFTPDHIRNRLQTVLKNSPQEVSKNNSQLLLPLSYALPPNDTIQLKEYQNFIKDRLEEHKNIINMHKKLLQNLQNCLEKSSEKESLVPQTVTIIRSIYEAFKKETLDNESSILPISASIPVLNMQCSYIQSIKKYIEIFRKTHTALKNKSDVIPSTTIVRTANKEFEITGTKDTFFTNKAKKFGRDFLIFVAIEQDIIKEHFPTLFDQPDYLLNKETTAQVKKEVMEVSSTYSILLKELSKIALASTSAQKTNHKISPEYSEFLDVFVSHSTSLPSPEEFISLTLKNPFDDFFSEKEVEALGHMITHLEDLLQNIVRGKMTMYCKEYVRLNSAPSSLKKPLIRSEESFVSLVQVEKEASCIAKQADLEMSPSSSSEESLVKLTDSLKNQESTYVEDEEEGASCIVEQHNVNILESPSSSTGAISKSTLSQKNDTPLDELENVRNNTQALYSLRKLQPVQIRKKLSKFRYENRIKLWVSDSKKALNNPAYKNVTRTKSNQKETVAFHSFPKIIDGLLGTNYCQEEEFRDSKGELRETSYSIPAMIIMQDIQHEGYFEYAVNDKQICYHRCFNSKRKSIANKDLHKDFSSDQYFSHEKLNIQCDPDTQTIRIDDPSHEMEIYIFPIPIDN